MILLFYYIFITIITYFGFIAISEKYNIFVSFRILPKNEIDEYKEEWKNLTTLEKTDFILAVFFTMLLLINLCLGFIDKYHSLFIVFCFIVYLIAKSIYLYPSDIIPPKEQIKELLSERWDRWKSRSGLKKTYFVLASVVVFIFVYSFWFIFPEFIDKIDNKDTSFYNLSVAVFAIFSGFGAVFGFYTSIVRTETAEQGQITDRLNKAIENLGKITVEGDPVIEVRIGALYALERIAQDSIRDHIQIMEILFAYVRRNSPQELGKNKNKDGEAQEDIKAAVAIIARRGEWPEGKKRLQQELQKKCSIRLNSCDLRGALLYDGNMRGAAFLDSNMERMVLIGTDMCGAWVNGANMSGTLLGGADMKGAKTDTAFAYTCDLSECKNLTQKQLNVMFLEKGIDVPENRTHPQEGTKYDKTYNTFDQFFTAYQDWLINVYPTLPKTFEE